MMEHAEAGDGERAFRLRRRLRVAIGVDDHGDAEPAQFVEGAGGAGDRSHLVGARPLPAQPAFGGRGRVGACLVIFIAEVEHCGLVHVEHRRRRLVVAGQGPGIVERRAGCKDDRLTRAGMVGLESHPDMIDQRIIGLLRQRRRFARAEQILHVGLGTARRGGRDKTH